MCPNDCSCRLLGGATDCRDGAFGNSNGNCHYNADCRRSYINGYAGPGADFVAYGFRAVLSNAHADFSAYTNGDVYPGAYGNPHTGTHANFGTYANSDAIACVGEQAESGAYGRHCRDYN